LSLIAVDRHVKGVAIDRDDDLLAEWLVSVRVSLACNLWALPLDWQRA
jgi:hypothetical protein